MMAATTMNQNNANNSAGSQRYPPIGQIPVQVSVTEASEDEHEGIQQKLERISILPQTLPENNNHLSLSRSNSGQQLGVPQGDLSKLAIYPDFKVRGKSLE
jgi:hypothetical protein